MESRASSSLCTPTHGTRLWSVSGSSSPGARSYRWRLRSTSLGRGRSWPGRPRRSRVGQQNVCRREVSASAWLRATSVSPSPPHNVVQTVRCSQAAEGVVRASTTMFFGHTQSLWSTTPGTYTNGGRESSPQCGRWLAGSLGTDQGARLGQFANDTRAQLARAENLDDLADHVRPGDAAPHAGVA